jgi:hypothetical protein
MESESGESQFLRFGNEQDLRVTGGKAVYARRSSGQVRSGHVKTQAYKEIFLVSSETTQLIFQQAKVHVPKLSIFWW